MFRFTLFCLSALPILIWSCSDEVPHPANAAQKRIPERKDTIVLETIVTYPEDINGCSSSYSASKKGLNGGKYLFVSSYDSIAYIKVSGKLIRMKLVSTNRKPEEFYGDNVSEVYQGGGFKLRVSSKLQKQSGKEVWEYGGYLEIEQGTKARARIKVVGETGC